MFVEYPSGWRPNKRLVASASNTVAVLIRNGHCRRTATSVRGRSMTKTQAGGATSGIRSSTWPPLVGVFGFAKAPTEKRPAKLVCVKNCPAKVSLQLWQMFYVGTGQTPGGGVETFGVPKGATTLYLEIADCAPLTAQTRRAADFSDNSGSFSVTVESIDRHRRTMNMSLGASPPASCLYRWGRVGHLVIYSTTLGRFSQ
jgi:hypothetical protein